MNFHRLLKGGLGLLVFVTQLLASSASAEEKLAQVVGLKEIHGQARCAQRLEAMLKAADYQVVDRSMPQEKVELRVETLGDCRLVPGDHHRCSVTATVHRRERQVINLRAVGSSLGSWEPALDQACRQLTLKTQQLLSGHEPNGRAGAGGDDSPKRKAALVRGELDYGGGRPALCGQRVEAVLRRGGYRLVDRSVDESKVQLVVTMVSSCTKGPRRTTVCAVQARVSGEQQFELSAQGSSFGSDAFALDEACRQVAQQLSQNLGLPEHPEQLSARTSKDQTRAVAVRVKWTGRLEPMPLLVLKRFFSQTGYGAKLVDSQRFGYGYSVELTEPLERLSFLLESYLKNHYPARCIHHGQDSLVCRIGNSADGNLARLISLADLLDGLAQRAKDSGELEKVPPWAHAQASLTWNPEKLDRMDRLALSKIVAGPAPVRVRALAMLQLAEGRQIEDLNQLEPLLDQSLPAGSWPMVHVGQMAQPTYPVSWEKLTLGQVAHLAVQRIVGTRFTSPQVYRAWRKKQGPLNQSLAYWEGVLSRKVPGHGRQELLKGLKSSDRELFHRVLLTRLSSDHDLYGWDETDLLTSLQSQPGAKGLLALLAGGESWPEFQDPQRFAYFSRWVLQRWKVLLGEQASQSLLHLWKTQKFPEARWVRRDLALAAAQANPARREEILTAALAENSSEWLAAVLEELTRHHLETQRALIAKRFWAKESMATSDNRLAILRGLSSLGQNGRSVLSDLVLSEKFVCDDPEVLEAVQKTGQALGEEDLICPGQLRFKRFKGLDRKKADAARQQTLNARLECLKLIRSRLSKSKTR